jgi:hypothetical protein
VKGGERPHPGGEFFDRWSIAVVCGSGHPGVQLPEVAGMFDERSAAGRRNRYWHDSEATYGGMLKYGVDEPQPVGCWRFERPAAQDELAAWRGDPPELRTAHATGRTQELNLGCLAIGRINGKYTVVIGHFCCECRQRAYER